MQTKPMDCYNTTFNQPSHETQLDLKAAHHLNAEMKVPHFVASEETLDLAIKAGFELEFISDISPKSIGCSAASNKPQNDEMVASQSIQKSGDRVKQVPCNFAKHISQSKDTVKLDPSCAYGIMISKEIFFKDNYQFMAKFI